MKNYFYEQNGKSVGPVDRDELVCLFHEGNLREDTLVWSEGMSQWQTFAKQFPKELPEMEMVYSIEEMETEEESHVRLTEVAPSPELGGIFNRFVAFVLDNLLLIPVNLAGIYLFFGEMPRINPLAVAPEEQEAMRQIFWLVSLIYVVYQTMLVSLYGATWGKMIMRLRVVDTEGNPLGWLNAFWRAIGHVLVGSLLYVGFIFVFFTKKRQGVHDFLARSMVIKKD